MKRPLFLFLSLFLLLVCVRFSHFVCVPLSVLSESIHVIIKQCQFLCLYFHSFKPSVAAYESFCSEESIYSIKKKMPFPFPAAFPHGESLICERTEGACDAICIYFTGAGEHGLFVRSSAHIWLLNIKSKSGSPDPWCESLLLHTVGPAVHSCMTLSRCRCRWPEGGKKYANFNY